MGIFDSIKSILGISSGTPHNTPAIQITGSAPTNESVPLHRVEFIIRHQDEETLQKLVNKYITPSIEEVYKNYGFQPSSNTRKYSNQELRTKVEYMVIHFLDACSENKHWIRDSVNPDSYFSNYSDLLTHLQILIEFEPYFPFETPVPSSLYADYSSNREKYNSEFIKRWFESVTSKASSLKTLEGRKKRIEKNCSEIMLYKQFMTENNISLVNSLKGNVDLETITKTENSQESTQSERMSNKKRYSQEMKKQAYTTQIDRMKKYDIDLIEVTGNGNLCEQCSMYNNRVFSLSGKDKRFMKLPEFLSQNYGHCLQVYPHELGVSILRDDNGNIVDTIKHSNRPLK